jgi:serine/threonine protein kinase/Tfp pilus assembly protein PilF
MIGRTVSHYRIVEKLGEGGMGEVYLAEDIELKRKVALKFLPKRIASDPDALARFKREAQAAAALNHPNIITVHEIGRHEDQSFIAMAYIDGDPLDEELRKGISLERALDVVGQVCAGLDKAHRAGIVHRDIKPENLLIDPDGRVKILDFGLATFGEPGAPQADDSTGGTLCYMSPEQVRGEKADVRSDVFSLGAVLYEILAGKRPFKGEHTDAVRYSILHEDPEPLSRLNPRVTPELERIVAKALAKDPAERYASAALLAGDLESVSTAPTSTSRKSSLRRLAIPGALVVLAVVLLMVVNPFDVKISSEQDAVAGENILAIMYFENMVQQGDPRRLGEIITNLLITNLSQSQDLKVVSSQRLYDILKQKGKEEAKVIDRTTASEIARTARARWMMLGSILQVEPHLVVTTQLVEVATGNIESSQRLTGTPGETVFDVVDRMTGETRTELAVPVRLDVERPRPVAEVTTASLDAYRHYVEGLELARKYYEKEACESFSKALDYDSTFAMAHYHYAWSAVSGGRYQEGFAAFDKAARYAARVSERERLYIESSKAWFEGDLDEARAKLTRIINEYPDEKEAYQTLANLYHFQGDREAALRNYRRVLALDPLDKESYNNLAYLYDRMGNFEKSIWAINQYIELAPGEANPYDSRGDLYAFNGDLDNAIISYQKAVEIKPDFLRTVEKIGNMHLYKGQYDKADAQYRRLIASDQPVLRSSGWLSLARIPLYQGRLREGLAALDAGIAADEESEPLPVETYMRKLFLRASVLAELQQNDRSQAEARRYRDVAIQAFPRFSEGWDLSYADICAHNDRIAEAESVLGRYETALDTLNDMTQEFFHVIKGLVALKKNDSETARRHLEIAEELETDRFRVRYWLAEVYLMDNQVDEAIATLEGILKRYDRSRLYIPMVGVRGHYLLGTAYQQVGRNDEAIEQYRTFLEIWKDADPELDEVSDAKRRLEALVAGI